jgi:hypothetical protein
MKTTKGYRIMRQIQMCLLFIAICFGVQRVQGQSCFVQLGDATGLDISEYENELEAAACALIDAFPEEYQDSFKVFDFGFYAYHPYYAGGVPLAFQTKMTEVQGLSKYYLAIGRDLSESKNRRIWIKVYFPDCISNSDNGILVSSLYNYFS